MVVSHPVRSVAAAAWLIAATGCQLEAKAKRTPLLYDETAAAEVERGEIETGRRLTADADIYQPSFRLLDVCCGRVRLIVQDPITHHYKVVGP